MSGLYEVSPEQLLEIATLVQRLLKEVGQPEGCAMNPDDMAKPLRGLLEIIEVNRQLPKPTGRFKPDDFLYLSQPPKLLGLPIEELGLTTAPYHCLKREGVDNLGFLLEWAEAELLDLRNFGRKSLDEVNTKLGELGGDLHLSHHDRGIEAPAGDEWVELVERTILRSRLAHVLVDSLYDTQADDWTATRRVFFHLRVTFRIERVGILLTYTPADILAFDWASEQLDPEDALARITSALHQYGLHLRAA